LSVGVVSSCATSGTDISSPVVPDGGINPDGGVITECPEGYFTPDGDPANCVKTEGCTVTDANDPIDPEFKDENCDGSDGVLSKCVFVTKDGIDDPSGGARNTPFKTIAYATLRAKERGKNVCVAGGETFPAVAMESGVSLYGGFNPRASGFPFKREKGSVSTLSAKGSVVTATVIDVDTHLEGFTINAAVPDGAAAGSGVYGIRLGGGKATLFVRYNTIKTAPGAAGNDGANGDGGATGENGDVGLPGCACNTEGTNGKGGDIKISLCGGGLPSGKGGKGGYDTASGEKGGDGSGAGSTGGTGGAPVCTLVGGKNNPGNAGGKSTADGAAGTDGAAAVAKGTLGTDALFTSAQGADGTSGAPGNAGAGGGGGGGGEGGTITCWATKDMGGGGGSGGTGGCAGTGGKAGQGGGASFGIVARAGRLTAAGNSFDVGAGGAGGKGGTGGDGGPGGVGGAGGAGNDNGGAGGKGGDGTKGGNGGGAAGGPGGPSACFAVTKEVVFTDGPTPANTCKMGGGGLGGAGGTAGANAGPTGESETVLKY
jgi:hypothetical protein